MFEVIKYNGDNKTLVYRYPEEDFNTKSQLIVQQSQEAIFYSRGQLADHFKEGTYTLNTKNIPILSGLVNLPFGKESPFSAVVYFINTTEQINVKWGLPKVAFTEPEFKALLNVGAHGTLTFKVQNAKVFLSKLVGQKTSFTQDEVMEFMRDFIISRGRNRLANIFNTRVDFDIFTIETQIETLSNVLKEALTEDFSEYGLQLEKLLVTGVSKDEENPAYQQLLQRRQQRLEIETIKLEKERQQAAQIAELELEANRRMFEMSMAEKEQDLAKRGVMADADAQAYKRQREGYTYQQERGFDVAEKTAENEGVGNFASAGMGIGIGVGAAGIAATAVGGMYNDALSAISSPVTPERKDFSASNDVFSGIGLEDLTNTTNAGVTPNPSKRSKKERLSELEELFVEKYITEEEYNNRRLAIINEV